MKLRPITIIEIILFLVSCIGYFSHSAHISYLNLVVFITFMFLGCIYFPLGFYTLKSPGLNVGYSAAAGFLFAITITQALFGLLKWPKNAIVFEVILAIYLIVFLVLLCIFIYKKQRGRPIKFDKGLLIRLTVYFLFILYAFLNYKPK